jgi:hypothetical protein
MAFSLQVNYTNRATTTGWQILVPALVIRGVSHGQCGRTPMAVNLSFTDHSHYFFIHVGAHLSSRGWVDPIPDLLLLKYSNMLIDRPYRP